ncbi:MAG: PspC domain-containing protein [Crocinitomicaceae bacterium]|nr:PspC domain-containing protein [Crocinitomicaceae bacterium]
MNKTISINIAGFVFNIEEQAYEKLSRYLDSIKNNFKNEPDCDEIMADIEARIAELFQDNLSDRKEVILDEDVEEVIGVMGKPEDYVSEETADNFNHNEDKEDAEYVEAEEVNSDEEHRSRPNSKRLFRDETNGHIGGVCQGLGWFFGIDPTLIRLGFILLTILGGSGILVYIILWIVVPQARTTAEILEMQGEPINLGSIKDHVKGMKDNVNESTKKAGKRVNKAGKRVKKAVDRSGRMVSPLAETLSKVIGGIFVVGGICALFLLVIILFGNTGLLPLVGSDQVENLNTLLDILYPNGRSLLVFIAIAMATLIPIISGIVIGMKMLLTINYRLKEYSIVASVLWCLAIITLVLTGIELGVNFQNKAEIDYDVPVQIDSSNVLTIDVAEDDIFSNYIEYRQVWNFSELIRVSDEQIFLGYPELSIVEQADSGDFEVTLYKLSQGKYHKEAIHKAENIKFELEQSENKLLLSPYFAIDAKEKLRNQRIKVIVHVPKGKKVKFGPNIDRIMVGVDDDYYHHSESYANTVWTVDDGGFRCIECKERRVYDDNDIIIIDN